MRLCPSQIMPPARHEAGRRTIRGNPGGARRRPSRTTPRLGRRFALGWGKVGIARLVHSFRVVAQIPRSWPVSSPPLVKGGARGVGR